MTLLSVDISGLWHEKSFCARSQLQVFRFGRGSCRGWRLVDVLWRHIRVGVRNRGQGVSVLWRNIGLRFRSCIAWCFEAAIPLWLVWINELLHMGAKVFNPSPNPFQQPLGQPKQVWEAALWRWRRIVWRSCCCSCCSSCGGSCSWLVIARLNGAGVSRRCIVWSRSGRLWNSIAIVRNCVAIINVVLSNPVRGYDPCDGEEGRPGGNHGCQEQQWQDKSGGALHANGCSSRLLTGLTSIFPIVLWCCWRHKGWQYRQLGRVRFDTHADQIRQVAARACKAPPRTDQLSQPQIDDQALYGAQIYVHNFQWAKKFPFQIKVLGKGLFSIWRT